MTIRRMTGLGVGVLYVSHPAARGRRARRPRRGHARRPPRARVRGRRCRHARSAPRSSGRRSGLKEASSAGVPSPAPPSAAAAARVGRAGARPPRRPDPARSPAARPRRGGGRDRRPVRAHRRRKTSLLEALFGIRPLSAAARAILYGRPLSRRVAARGDRPGCLPRSRGSRRAGRAPRVVHRAQPEPAVPARNRPTWVPRPRRRTAPGRRGHRRPRRRRGGASAPLRSLSGGNQQKVVVGRWLGQTARLLLLDEPFRGVDLGARADIGTRLRDRRGARDARGVRGRRRAAQGGGPRRRPT